MTLVCCWLNESYGRTRITAIADARASFQRPDGSYEIISDATSKLLRLRVRCHHLNALNHETGAWLGPYYETEIAIGFCGQILEAWSIITLFAQSLEQLVAPNGGAAKPDDELLAGLLAEICQRFFHQHGRPVEQRVEFLMFGYSPTDRTPWLWSVSHTRNGGVKQSELILGPSEFHYIGAAGPELSKKVNELRGRIEKHRNRLRRGAGPDSIFEWDLESERHLAADKKIIEAEVLKWFGDELESIGGVPQKLEAFEADGQTVVAFSRGGADSVLDGLPSAGADGLRYVSVVERLGR